MDKSKSKFKLRRDRYMSVRGGTSAFYNIYCAHCRHWILLYQKDGPGNLFRLYLDSDTCAGEYSEGQGLTCSRCGALIGVPMIYKPEHRPALRLVLGAIIKKKSDGVLPAPPTADKKENTDEDSDS